MEWVIRNILPQVQVFQNDVTLTLVCVSMMFLFFPFETLRVFGSRLDRLTIITWSLVKHTESDTECQSSLWQFRPGPGPMSPHDHRSPTSHLSNNVNAKYATKIIQTSAIVLIRYLDMVIDHVVGMRHYLQSNTFSLQKHWYHYVNLTTLLIFRVCLLADMALTRNNWKDRNFV